MTDSPLTGITRNPWNTERTPGGSSGGAAAQVAAGMGQLAVGTDGGGSIRIPCAFAGISGIKAGFGRVPAWPLSPFGTVAHVGPMARTVADCALMLNVLSQADARDWTALPYAHVDWTQALDAGVKDLRIAYSPRLGYVKNVDAEVAARVADAVKVLAGLGAQVEEVDPGFADCRETFWVHWTSGAYNLLRNLPREKFALLDPGLQQACASGAQHTLAHYLDAVNARGALGEHIAAFPPEIRFVAHTGHFDPGLRRRRACTGTPAGRGRLDLVDAVFLSLQPDAAAGDVRALRVFRGRLAHRRAAGGADAARGSGAARGACLSAGDRPSSAPAAALIAPLLADSIVR